MIHIRLILAVAVILVLTKGGARSDEALLVAALEKSGAEIVRDESLPGKPIIKVVFDNLFLTDADLAVLNDLKSLKIQSLVIKGRLVTDAGLRGIAGLTTLKSLSLRTCKNVTDKDLKILTGLKELQELDLAETSVTCASFVDLVGLKKLGDVDLSATNTTDAGLKAIGQFRQLRSLSLKNTEVTDVGLKEIKALTQLQSLNLYGTRATDSGIKELGPVW